MQQQNITVNAGCQQKAQHWRRSFPCRCGSCHDQLGGKRDGLHDLEQVLRNEGDRVKYVFHAMRNHMIQDPSPHLPLPSLAAPFIATLLKPVSAKALMLQKTQRTFKKHQDPRIQNIAVGPESHPSETLHVVMT